MSSQLDVFNTVQMHEYSIYKYLIICKYFSNVIKVSLQVYDLLVDFHLASA